MTSDIRMIPIHKVEVSSRLRNVESEAVLRLARSMVEQGLITPIEVIETADDSYRLVVGAHRLAAAHELGWETIQAIIFKGDDVAARLREIDENLHRAELTPYDEASFLAMRWHLWEQLHGKAKRGGDRRSIDWRGSNLQVDNLKKAAGRRAFYAETAAALGVSEQTIRRAVKRRIALNTHWKEIGDQKDVAKGVDLDLLVKLKGRRREEALDRVASGERIEEVVREIKAAIPKTALSDDKVLKRLIAAWEVASDEVRSRFLSEMHVLQKKNKKGQ